MSTNGPNANHKYFQSLENKVRLHGPLRNTFAMTSEMPIRPGDSVTYNHGKTEQQSTNSTMVERRHSIKTSTYFMGLPGNSPSTHGRGRRHSSFTGLGTNLTSLHTMASQNANCMQEQQADQKTGRRQSMPNAMPVSLMDTDLSNKDIIQKTKHKKARRKRRKSNRVGSFKIDPSPTRHQSEQENAGDIEHKVTYVAPQNEDGSLTISGLSDNECRETSVGVQRSENERNSDSHGYYPNLRIFEVANTSKCSDSTINTNGTNNNFSFKPVTPLVSQPEQSKLLQGNHLEPTSCTNNDANCQQRDVLCAPQLDTSSQAITPRNIDIVVSRYKHVDAFGEDLSHVETDQSSDDISDTNMNKGRELYRGVLTSAHSKQRPSSEDKTRNGKKPRTRSKSMREASTRKSNHSRRRQSVQETRSNSNHKLSVESPHSNSSNRLNSWSRLSKNDHVVDVEPSTVTSSFLHADIRAKDVGPTPTNAVLLDRQIDTTAMKDHDRSNIKQDSLKKGFALLTNPAQYLDFDRTLQRLENPKPNTEEKQEDSDNQDESQDKLPELKFQKHPRLTQRRRSENLHVAHRAKVKDQIAATGSGYDGSRRRWSDNLDSINLDFEWLKWVKVQFMKVAGEDEEIDRDEFKAAMGIKDTFFTERFFDLFDTEKSGTLDLHEFTQAMTLMRRGSPTDKLRFLFEVYDVDGSGEIDLDELRTVLQHCVRESNMQLSDAVIEDLVITLFEAADEDKSGAISFDELYNVLKQHPGVIESLTLSAAKWITEDKKKTKKKSKDPLHTRIRQSILNNKCLFFWTLIYIFINLGLFITSIRYIQSGFALVVARATGMSLNIHSSLVLVLMLRHSLTWLRSTKLGRILPIDHHILLHRVAGYAIVLLSVVHTVAHLVNLSIIVDSEENPAQLKYWEFIFTFRSQIGLIPGFAYLSGVFLVLALVIIFVCALPFIRRNGYFQVFYFTHLLYAIYWLILILHAPIFWIFFVIPGVIFVLEKIVPIVKKKVTRERFFIKKVNLLPSKVTHLVISRPTSFSFRPGDYIFIKIPSIAKHEYHPFTISSAPEISDTFWLHIRAVGSWTKSLYAYFEEKEKQASLQNVNNSNSNRDNQHIGDERNQVDKPDLQEVVVSDASGSNPSMGADSLQQIHKENENLNSVYEEVYIRGPYGTPTREIFESEHAVLIGAGIGVTPFASIMQSVMHRFKIQKEGGTHPDGPMKLRKLDFIWLNREQASFEWFLKLLSELDSGGDHAEEFANFYDMQMYMTSALSMNDMKGLGIQIALDLVHKKQNKDVVTGLKQRVQPGRPDWNKVFDAIAKEDKGKVHVFFCGAPLLAKQLKEHCDKYNFIFSKEEF